MNKDAEHRSTGRSVKAVEATTSTSLREVNQRSGRKVQAVAAGILSHNPEPYSQPSSTDFLPSGADVVSLLDREDRL